MSSKSFQVKRQGKNKTRVYTKICLISTDDNFMYRVLIISKVILGEVFFYLLDYISLFVMGLKCQHLTTNRENNLFFQHLKLDCSIFPISWSFNVVFFCFFLKFFFDFPKSKCGGKRNPTNKKTKSLSHFIIKAT